MAKPFELLKVNDPQAGFVDLELYFHTEVLKLESLHYGYWTNGEALTLHNFKQAQKHYTESLISMIPKGVSGILDVGCGVGDNARALAAQGYLVTCISPDAEHEKFLRDIPGITFRRTKFEDFPGGDAFDLILMSESQNYFDRDTAFVKCRELLQPGGYLLVSGLFRRADSRAFDDTNIESEYVRAAEGFGLALAEHIDITDQALPTIDFARHMYEDHVEPAVRLLGYYANANARWKMALIKLFFARQLRKIDEIRSFIRQRTDPDHFRKHLKYSRLLFQRQPS